MAKTKEKFITLSDGKKAKVIKTISLHFIITGEFITTRVRYLLLEHNLTFANQVFDCLIPKPTEEQRKMVLFGDAEFIGATKCKNPNCEQCKDDKPFAWVVKEDNEYKKLLANHKNWIKKNFIEIDGDTIVEKEAVIDIIASQKKYDELRKARKEVDDYDAIHSNDMNRIIVDAQDDLEYSINYLYNKFGLSKDTIYEIGSKEWKRKLDVDGLLELIKAQAITSNELTELFKSASNVGIEDAFNTFRKTKIERFIPDSLERKADEAEKERKKKKAMTLQKMDYGDAVTFIIPDPKNKMKPVTFKVPRILLHNYNNSMMHSERISKYSRCLDDIDTQEMLKRQQTADSNKAQGHYRIFEFLNLNHHEIHQNHKIESFVQKAIEEWLVNLSLEKKEAKTIKVLRTAHDRNSDSLGYKIIDWF